MNHNISTQLAEFIANEILKQPDRAIDPQEALISSGLVDSFSLVDLALFVEVNFDVRIEDNELSVDTFDTLDDLSEVIRQRQG